MPAPDPTNTSVRGGQPWGQEPQVLVLPTHYVTVPRSITFTVVRMLICKMNVLDDSHAPPSSEKSDSQLPFKESFLRDRPEKHVFLAYCIARS